MYASECLNHDRRVHLSGQYFRESSHLVRKYYNLYCRLLWNKIEQTFRRKRMYVMWVKFSEKGSREIFAKVCNFQKYFVINWLSGADSPDFITWIHTLCEKKMYKVCAIAQFSLPSKWLFFESVVLIVWIEVLLYYSVCFVCPGFNW